jgi:repressor of nif and glnA expression
MAFMYDTSLVLEMLDTEVIFNICHVHIDDLLTTLKQIKEDLS